MIIWARWGIFGLLIPCALIIAAIAVIPPTDPEDPISVKRAKDIGFAIGSLVAAGIIWPLGLWMNRSESRILYDEQTGQHVELAAGGGHTLFFIPLQYWAFIWVAFGLYRFFR